MDTNAPILTVHDVVAGYAYAGTYRARAAYDYSVEDSVYIAPEHLGQGLGRTLLGTLIELCTEAGYRRMIAVIRDYENEDFLWESRRLGRSMMLSARAPGPSKIVAITSAVPREGKSMTSLCLARTLAAPAAADLGQVERVHGLSGLPHHEVRRIDDVVDRPHAEKLEATHDPRRR